MPPLRQLSRFLVLCVLACSTPVLADELDPFDVEISSAIVSLPLRIRDAEFSSSLNAIIAVSESPSQLHIYRPDTNELVSVNLQVTPYCVSVSPDGLFAAVGHDAWISHVDLESATLLQTIPIPVVIYDIVLAGNGWVYAFPATDQWVEIHSVNLTTGTQSSQSGLVYERTIGRLHPGGTAMYGAWILSPSDIEKYNISTGPAQVGADSPYHGDYAMCGNLWFSADGQRIYTSCGNVFRSSSDPNLDMTWVASFSQPVNMEWATHTQTGSNLAVLPEYPAYSTADGEVRYFTPDSLFYRGKAVLPRFVSGQDTWAARGRWVFFNAAGTKQYVVVQPETASGLSNVFGLVTVDCSNASLTLNPTAAAHGSSAGNGQVSVTGAPACGWRSTSNDSWINSSSIGIGDGTVTYTVNANPGVAPRSGTISVGGVTFGITQEGARPTSLVATATSPSSVSLTWSLAVSADHFEVWRSSGGTFSLVGSPSTPSFTDSTVPNTGYVYRVRAVLTGGAVSEFSTPDYAHTFTLTDPLLSAGVLIRAAHVTELRDTVNAIRAAAGLPSTTFTDPSLVSMPVKRTHVTELRDAIQEIRASLSLPTFSFTTVPENDWVRASTTEELREGAR